MDITFLIHVVLFLILLVILLFLTVWFIYYIAEKFDFIEPQGSSTEESLGEKKGKGKSKVTTPKTILRRYIEKLTSSPEEEQSTNLSSLSIKSLERRKEGLLRSSFGFDMKSMESGKVVELPKSTILTAKDDGSLLLIHEEKPPQSERSKSN